MKSFMLTRQNKQHEDALYRKQKEYENKLNQKRQLLHQEFKLKDFNDQIIDKTEDIIPVKFNEIYCKWLNVNKKQESTLNKLQEQLNDERDKMEFEKGPDESKFSKFEPNFSVAFSNKRKKDLGTTMLSLNGFKDKNYLQENIEKLETTLQEKEEQFRQEQEQTKRLKERINQITLSKKQQKEELNQIKKMSELMAIKQNQFNEITRKAQTKAIQRKREEKKNEQEINSIKEMENQYIQTKKQKLDVLQKQNEKQEISIAQIQVKILELQKKNALLVEEIEKLDQENLLKQEKEKKNYIIGQQIWLLDNVEKLFLKSDPETEFDKYQTDAISTNNLDLDYQINILDLQGNNSRLKTKGKKGHLSSKQKSNKVQMSKSRQPSPISNKSGLLEVQDKNLNQGRRKSVSMSKLPDKSSSKRCSKMDIDVFNSQAINQSQILNQNDPNQDKNIKDVEFLKKNHEVHQWLLHQQAPLLNRSQILKYLEEYYQSHDNPQNLDEVTEQICKHYYMIQQQIDGQENWLEYLTQQRKNYQQELKELDEEIEQQRKNNPFLDTYDNESNIQNNHDYLVPQQFQQIQYQKSIYMEKSEEKVRENLNDTDNENFESYKEDYFLEQGIAMDTGIMEIKNEKIDKKQGQKAKKITEKEEQEEQENEENDEKAQKLQNFDKNQNQEEEENSGKKIVTVNLLGGAFEDDAHRDRDPNIKKYDQWSENNQKFIFSIFYNVQEFLQKIMDMVFIMAKKAFIPEELYQDINSCYQRVFQDYATPQYFALKMFAGTQRASKINNIAARQEQKKNSFTTLQESKFTNLLKNGKLKNNTKVQILSYFMDYISQDKMFKYFVNPSIVQSYWKKYEPLSTSEMNKDEFMNILLKQIGQLRSLAFDNMAKKQIELFDHFLTVFKLIQKYSQQVYESIKKQNPNFEIVIFKPLNIPKHAYIQAQYNLITERMMGQKVSFGEEHIKLLQDTQSLQQNQERNQFVENQRNQIQEQINEIKYYDQKKQQEQIQKQKEDDEKRQVYFRLLEEKPSKKQKIKQLSSIYGINQALESLSIQQKIQDKDEGNKICKLKQEVSEKLSRIKQEQNLLSYHTQNKFTNHFQAPNESYIIRKHLTFEERQKYNNWKYPSQSTQFELPQFSNYGKKYLNNLYNSSNSNSISQQNIKLPQTTSHKSIKKLEYPTIDINKETLKYARSTSNKDINFNTQNNFFTENTLKQKQQQKNKPKTSEGLRKTKKSFNLINKQPKKNQTHIEQLKNIIKQENYGLEKTEEPPKNQQNIQNLEKSQKTTKKSQKQLILPRQIRPKTQENLNTHIFQKKSYNNNFANNNNNSQQNEEFKNSLHYKWIQQNQKSQQKNMNFQPVDLKSKNQIQNQIQAQNQNQNLNQVQNQNQFQNQNQVLNQSQQNNQLLASENGQRPTGYKQKNNLSHKKNTQSVENVLKTTGSDNYKQNDFYINKYLPNQSSQADFQSTTYQDGTQSQYSLQTRKFGDNVKGQSQISNRIQQIDEY